MMTPRVLRRASRLGLLTLVLAGSLAPCSCSKKRPLYPVHGKVFFEGKPATKALVVFHPLDDPDPEPVQPHALVQPDGSFEIFTYQAGDGAPGGRYTVTVTAFVKKSAVKKAGPRHKPGRSRRRAARVKKAEGLRPIKQLPPFYADPKLSRLQVEVHEGVNELEPFNLTARPAPPGLGRHGTRP